MPKTEVITAVELPKTFTDVLYLTNDEEMPPEVKQLMGQRKLSYSILPVDSFAHVRDRLNLIGTVIIDAKDLDVLQQQKLAQIIESLEAGNIGVILLSSGFELPVKSFSLAPAKNSFSMAGTMESTSIDDLGLRISVNLAYRKKSARIALKPPEPTKQVRLTYKDKLSKTELELKAERETVSQARKNTAFFGELKKLGFVDNENNKEAALKLASFKSVTK